MSWTQEREDLLRKLWLQGLSASQIAYVMAGVTRNAVIGKAHRMGLPKRSPATSQRPKVRVQRGQPSLAFVSGRPAQRPVTGEDTARHAARDEFDVALAQANFEASCASPAGEDRITLMTLTSRTCKWPIGDPSDDDFHFCSAGADGAKSYCEFHHRLAYRGIRTRRATPRAESAVPAALPVRALAG
ncbi:GcrA family cell cycle regulator [Stappia sp.]|jgi:GcrA cell cycle regulator|uniref:GcrA family cell cycle regulator n=1 Tax=Stappia sp. TaxID=1870903 RepID=UPI003A999440